MGALDGEIKTPFGQMSKKTVVIGGVVIAGILGIGYWRVRRSGTSSETAVAYDENGINPATGYVYNSPEDLAALADQSNAGSGGGSGSMPDVTIGYATNAQWVQATIAYFVDNGIATPSLISEALGKYITGQFLRVDQVNLVEQAIAISGFPPVAGSTGFPPSINTTPPATPPPTTPPPTTPPPTTPPPTTPPPALPLRRYGNAHKYTNGSDPFSTLGGIAKAYGRSTAQLQQWNGISNPNLIYNQQKIYVDPPGNYSGETKVF